MSALARATNSEDKPAAIELSAAKRVEASTERDALAYPLVTNDKSPKPANVAGCAATLIKPAKVRVPPVGAATLSFNWIVLVVASIMIVEPSVIGNAPISDDKLAAIEASALARATNSVDKLAAIDASAEALFTNSDDKPAAIEASPLARAINSEDKLAAKETSPETLEDASALTALARATNSEDKLDAID